MPIFQKEKTEEEVGQLDQVRSQREYIERERERERERESVFRFPNIILPSVALSSSGLLLPGNAGAAAL